MSVPLLDLKPQYAALKEEIKGVVDAVMESQYFIMGPEVEGLENEVADYSHCKHGIGVSSGTDALLVSLMGLDVGPGDEVITTPYTFFATVGSIVRLGAKPVFVDIDPLTFNIDPNQIEAAVTEKTKAIMPVHLYGQMCDMDAIMAIAEKHGLGVVEDAAQAIGSESKGRRAGSLGSAGCFSFFPSKNLGGFGDGGMVTTNDSALYEKIKLLRNHGMDPKYYYKMVGGNFRLDALQAAVLRIKLKHLDSWSDQRQQNAAWYTEAFLDAGVAEKSEDIIGQNKSLCDTIKEGKLLLPAALPDNRHIYNQFIIRVPSRDKVRERLAAEQIGHDIYYPVPLHLQECFKDLGHKEGDFKASECAAKTTLALPIYPEVGEENIRTVVSVIADVLNG